MEMDSSPTRACKSRGHLEKKAWIVKCRRFGSALIDFQKITCNQVGSVTQVRQLKHKKVEFSYYETIIHSTHVKVVTIFSDVIAV